jgi:hypothetical protein
MMPHIPRIPRVRWHLVVVLLLCAGAAAAGDADAAQVLTPIRGTGVRLAVPEGFEIARDFPGIGRDEDLTSLLVTELSVPIDVSRQSFDVESLARRGIRADRIVAVRVDGRDGLLAHASQRAAGLVFRKWILLLGDDTRSVMLTATTPLDLEARYQRDLVETLRSARWTPSRDADSGGGSELPFRVDPVGPLRIVKSSANAVVLSEPGAAADGSPPPIVTVGASSAQVQIRDLGDFARRRLAESASIDSIELESERSRELDGMPGHEIRARARDIQSQRPVAVTQLLATDGAHYYLVQGIVDAEAGGDFAPLLDRLIASFRRVGDAGGAP